MTEHTNATCGCAAEEQNPMDLERLFRYAARLLMHGSGGHHGHHARYHPAQGRALALIGSRGSMDRRELLDILGVKSGSLSELLGKLEHHGLITKTKNPEDKRGCALSITEKGLAMIAQHEHRHAQRSKDAFTILSDEEREQLNAILAKLAVAWEEEGLSAFEEHHKGHCGHHGHGAHHGEQACGCSRHGCHGRHGQNGQYGQNGQHGQYGRSGERGHHGCHAPGADAPDNEDQDIQ